MGTVELILVILLAIGFLVLLILSIIVISLMLSILRSVKRISARAEEATASIADITDKIRNRITPIAMSAAVASTIRRFFNKKGD